MFFILSKIFAFVASPLLWFFFVLAVAFVTKNSLKRRRRFLFAIILLAFFSNSGFYQITAGLIIVKPVAVSELKPNYDFGIVLGGMASFDSVTHRPVFSEAGDRLAQTISLYKKGVLKKIIVSGGQGALFEKSKVEADYLKDYLVEIGISGEDVIAENRSKNTRQNALFTAEYLNSAGGNSRCLLITSATHIWRARRCFEKVGVSVDVFPTNYKCSRSVGFADFFVFTSGVLHKWSALLHEFIGIVTYKISGYI